jgi:hypothetical protein
MDTLQFARREAETRFNAGKRPGKLLANDNVKLLKAEKMDWRGMGLSLAPADKSGFQVCASASPECIKHCIFTAGMGAEHMSQKDGLHVVWMGRIWRTMWFFRDRATFMDKLYRDIANNRDAAIRLNVFSDWQWERQTITVSEKRAEKYGTAAGTFRNLFEVFPEVQFYDYTKHFARMFRDRPSNYHLTFSLHENNQHQAVEVLRAGMNVAAVTNKLSGDLFGYPVIDGDEHDLRFLDPSPMVVGLNAKGTLKSNPFKDMVYATEVLKAA